MHRIRLREPWVRIGGPLPEDLAFERKFNRPTGIGATQRILLQVSPVVSRSSSAPRLFLNDRPVRLNPHGPSVGWLSEPVTDRLAPYNRLVLASEAESSRFGSPDEHRAVDRACDIWNVALWILDPEDPLPSV